MGLRGMPVLATTVLAMLLAAACAGDPAGASDARDTADVADNADVASDGDPGTVLAICDPLDPDPRGPACVLAGIADHHRQKRHKSMVHA